MLRFLFSLALLNFCTLADAAIFVRDYTDATNDRFTNDASFIMSQFNLSGVGRTDAGDWVTAIAPNVVIGATHANVTGNAMFFPGNDPTATPVARAISGGMQIPGTDLYVASLAQDLPNSIQHYNFAGEALSGTPGTATSIFFDNAGSFQDMNAYIVGVSPAVDPGRSNFAFQAVGRNRVTHYSENVQFLGYTDADSMLLFFDGVGDANVVQHEAKLVSGDSGAPTFVEVNGQLVLLGINSFVANTPNTSGIAYTGNQVAAINGFIASVNPVPEPGTITMLALAASAGAAYRWSRKRKAAQST